MSRLGRCLEHVNDQVSIKNPSIFKTTNSPRSTRFVSAQDAPNSRGSGPSSSRHRRHLRALVEVKVASRGLQAADVLVGLVGVVAILVPKRDRAAMVATLHTAVRPGRYTRRCRGDLIMTKFCCWTCGCWTRALA